MSDTPETKRELNLVELAEEFNLDRATVAKRLADVPFRRGPKNSKLYDVELAAVAIEESEDSPEMEAAKLRRAIADAERAEINVAKLRGTLVNRIEVLTEVQEVFSRLYQSVTIQYIRRNAGRLSKLKTSAELAERLQGDLMAIFLEIADDYSFTTSPRSGDTPE